MQIRKIWKQMSSVYPSKHLSMVSQTESYVFPLDVSVKCPYQPAGTSFVLDGCCHVLYNTISLSYDAARQFCWANHGGQYRSDLAVPLSLVSLYNELQRKGVREYCY